MYQQNIQSLVAHVDELSVFAEANKPEVICVTETHVTVDIQDNELLIHGYNILRIDSNSRYTGGVAFYIKRGIKYSLVEIIKDDGEYWMGLVEIQFGKERLLIVGIYRSPSGREAEFLGRLDRLYLEKLEGIKMTVVVMGDFNINLNADNYYAGKLRTFISDIGYKQVVNECTHLSLGGNRSLIDLVITNNKWAIDCAVLSGPVFNRHSLIRVCVLTREQKQDYFTVRKRLESVEDLISQVRGISLQYRETDFNLKVSVYYCSLIEIIDKLMPKIEIRLRNRAKPWITNDIKSLMNVRDSQYRKYSFTVEDVDWCEYTNLRNQVVHRIRVNRKKYYRERVDENRGDSKSMWKYLKGVVANKGGETYNSVEYSGIRYSNRQDIVRIFNEYFVESIRNIKFTDKNKTDKKMKIKQFESISDFRILEYEELEHIVKNFRNKSSPDGVSIEIVKFAFTEIKEALLHVVNWSLEKGIVPRCLKISVIIPVRKVRNTVKIEEFRPINTLPSIAKILERAVYNQISEHVTKYKIIEKYQSGYRSGHSCEMAVQCLLNDWKNARDADNVIVVVFLDFKRAFETICRERLIKKLEMYGFKGNVLEWIKSYLSERFQKVRCDATESNIIESETGVPQGSILGPLLFLLYINDIGTSLEYSGYHLLADDTAIYIVGKDSEEMEHKINKDLENLYGWLESNKMKLNVDKTKAMIIGKDKKVENWINDGFAMKVGQSNIEIVEKHRYLGVIIDRELTFRDHMDYVCKKIAGKIGVLSRISGDFSEWSRRTIYNTIVLPHFIFGGTIIYLARMEDLRRLQVLQNRAMRVILGCNRYTRVQWMLDRLGWLRVGDLSECIALTFIHRIKCGEGPEYFDGLLRERNTIHEHDTRYKDNFIVNRYRCQNNKNTLFYKAVVAYNQLPVEMKNLDVKHFKGEVKVYYKTCR